jgi:1-acyl-sn-glycerol-3-phosphate acyltransferase
MALLAKCPVIPVAVHGTRDIQPPEKKMPGLRGRVEVVYGQPLRFDRFEGRDRDRFVLRSVTDEIMYEIMMLSGQEYVDEYASKVKAQQAKAEAPTAPATDNGAGSVRVSSGHGASRTDDGVHVTVHTRTEQSSDS